jgi:hypothetical protein
MATVEVLSRRHDFKYENRTWRADVQESFQKTTQNRTDYTVEDGQIVKTVETIWAFADAVAAASSQLGAEPLPSFLFFDKTYRKDPAYTFQKTHIKTTTYSAYGDSSYLLTISDYDVLTGKTTRTVSVVDGKMPLAPTINSALSNMVQRPIISDLEDNCDFIGSKTDIGNAYLEDGSDAARAAKRALQRVTAIVRTVTHPANPLMKLGHTVRLVAEKRGLDARHILTRRTITLDENGSAQQTTDFEFWTR